MELQTKALYNTLFFHFQEDPSLPYKKWQVEDLREIKTEDLWKRLKGLKQETFLTYAEEVDTPEELANLLYGEVEDFDQNYLLVFELWRRLFPQKTTLSIFCDELDRKIFLYEKGELKNDEGIQDSLSYLLVILGELTDKGLTPKEAIITIAPFIAHDLEEFLYDYITDQIQARNITYAAELWEGFYPFFMNDDFVFLKAHILSFSDSEEEEKLLFYLIQKQKEKIDLDLSLRILAYLAHASDKSLFLDLLKILLPHLETEEDLSEVLDSTYTYYERLDLEDMQKAIQKIMDKRKKVNLESKIQKENPVLKEFIQFIFPM
ncbi:MAG TPA: hypothetical protein VLG44_03950 [Chlamydiales bacterium]|nr:hypothetical protein [Chlamydiales bacterium]